MVVVDEGTEALGVDADGRDKLLDPVPDPAGAIAAKDQGGGLVRSQQTQIANQEREDPVGIPQRGIVERADMALLAAVLIDDVDGEYLGLPPGRTEAAVARLVPPPASCAACGPAADSSS